MPFRSQAERPDVVVPRTYDQPEAGRLIGTVGVQEGTVANIRKRPNGAWHARYRDSSGKEHPRHSVRKVDAHAWLDSVTAAVATAPMSTPQGRG